jgi:hypothetical protein
MRVLTAQGNRCGMKPNKPNMWAVARMQAMYGSGHSCAPTKASTARARRWSKVMEMIKSANGPEQTAMDRRG